MIGSSTKKDQTNPQKGSGAGKDSSDGGTEKISTQIHNATPGIVVDQNIGEPASKEELRKRMEELNKEWFYIVRNQNVVNATIVFDSICAIFLASAIIRCSSIRWFSTRTDKSMDCEELQVFI